MKTAFIDSCEYKNCRFEYLVEQGKEILIWNKCNFLAQLHTYFLETLHITDGYGETCIRASR